MRLVVITLLLVLCTVPVSAQTELTLKLGQEVDSNPIRLSGAGSDSAAAARFVVAVEHDSRVGEGRLTFDAQTLGRIYYGAAAEDSLSLSLSSELAGPVSERSSLSFHVLARNRIERARECAVDSATPCAVNQDYGSLSAGARYVLRLGDVSWSLSVGPRSFSFRPSSSFSWYGAGGLTGLDWRVHSNVTLGVFFDLTERFYRSDRQRITTANGLVYAEGERRIDRGSSIGGSVRWRRGSWSLAGKYLYQWNVSNSATRAYTRHLFEPSVTGIPFGDVLLRVSGRVTRSSFDPRRAQDATTNIDEESRNRVSVVVEQPLYSDVLFVEGGWTLYAQALHGLESADDESFRRTLAHIALTVRGRESGD